MVNKWLYDGYLKILLSIIKIRIFNTEVVGLFMKKCIVKRVKTQNVFLGYQIKF